MDEMLKKIAEVNQRQATQTRLVALQGDYDKTLALLGALKAGAVSLDAVQLTGDGWNLVNVTEAPAELVPECCPAEAACDGSDGCEVSSEAA